jgi:tRNA threonylcarbamoyl adenosine modification protein YeaZ
MQLVIDSATAACSAALIGPDGALIEERHEIVGRGHAERLLPMIADLLRGRVPNAILVDCGPGSFTGVRVGLAAAHGLAIGWKVELAGYSSLAAVAAASVATTPQAGDIAVALVGGHGELFVQNYGGDPIAPLDALRSLSP